MEVHLDALEIRPHFDRDPAGQELARYLAAQVAHEHATARRGVLVHVVALTGIPLWLSAAGIGSEAIRDLGLMLFPAPLLGLLVSVVAEWWSGRRLREAERGIDVRHKPF